MAPVIEGMLRLEARAVSPYLERMDPMGEVEGEVEASAGLASLEFDGTPLASVSNGPFRGAVAPPEGAHAVEVTARDANDKSLSMPAAFVRASYLPQGERNESALVLALDEVLLGQLVEGLTEGAGLDLSELLPPGTPLVDDDTCSLAVGDVAHESPTFSVGATDSGATGLTLELTDLAVSIAGSCTVLDTRVDVLEASRADEITAAVTLTLMPQELVDGCIPGFDVAGSEVEISSIDIDLELASDSPIAGLVLSNADGLIAELVEGPLRDLLVNEAGALLEAEAQGLVEQLDELRIREEIELLDAPIELNLCLSSVIPSGDRALAHMSAWVVGTPEMTAPGAPVLYEELPGVSGAGLVDTNFLGQLLHAAWTGGAFDREDVAAGSNLGVGLLQPFARELSGAYGDDFDASTPLRIDLQATLAPLAQRAPEGAAADVLVELSGLRVHLVAAGETPTPIFVIEVDIDAAFDLQIDEEGALTLVWVEDATTIRSWLVESAVEVGARTRSALPAFFVDTLFGTVGNLLGDVTLDLLGAGIPVEVVDVRQAGGSHLELVVR